MVSGLVTRKSQQKQISSVHGLPGLGLGLELRLEVLTGRKDFS